MGYLFVATVKWDPAKIWQEGTQKAIDMCTELGIIPNFSDPQNKNTNGTAECLVRQEELLMKAGLAQSGAAPWLWQYVSECARTSKITYLL